MWTLKLMGDLYLEHTKNLCKSTKQIQETRRKWAKSINRQFLKLLGLKFFCCTLIFYSKPCRGHLLSLPSQYILSSSGKEHAILL